MFIFFCQILHFLCFLGLRFAFPAIDYTITIIIFSGDSEAQTQQTQKMQNLMEKNENSAQKNACFHFFHSIFSKSKYMSHPFSISTYRKSKIAPLRHNCVAGINFSGKTAVSKISYQVLCFKPPSALKLLIWLKLSE